MVKKRVYFTIDAPNAQDVQVLGSFNAWSARPLKQQKDGLWKTWTSLEPGVYEYRYQVDGAWQNPPEVEETENPYGSKNAVARVL